MLTISIIRWGNKMLIVGQACSEEEAKEVNFIAKVFAVGERIRYIASQNKKN